jgi:predicted nucleic acid-binding protein
MILAIDTNILLDILIPNTRYVQSSLNCLMNSGPNDDLIICEVVFAELASQFLSFQDLTMFLSDTGVGLVPSNENSLFEASNAWKKYPLRKKDAIICPACGRHQQAICPSCNEIVPYRQHILSDFLIGAHGKIQADTLITRDRGFYRTYFKGLNILTPR